MRVKYIYTSVPYCTLILMFVCFFWLNTLTYDFSFCFSRSGSVCLPNFFAAHITEPFSMMTPNQMGPGCVLPNDLPSGPRIQSGSACSWGWRRNRCPRLSGLSLKTRRHEFSETSPLVGTWKHGKERSPAVATWIVSWREGRQGAMGWIINLISDEKGGREAGHWWVMMWSATAWDLIPRRATSIQPAPLYFITIPDPRERGRQREMAGDHSSRSLRPQRRSGTATLSFGNSIMSANAKLADPLSCSLALLLYAFAWDQRAWLPRSRALIRQPNFPSLFHLFSTTTWPESSYSYGGGGVTTTWPWSRTGGR